MNETGGNWQALVKEQEFNSLLMEWNVKVNLVSRKKNNILDLIDDSRLFFGAIDFKPGINILDLGTGGGIPGIVIAVNHPGANLVLVDSVQKKINVVSDIIKKMNLSNASAVCARAEELSKNTSGENSEYYRMFDYVVARSVTVLQDLCKWSFELLKPGGKLVCVKGGDISGEISMTRKLAYIKNLKITDSGERKIITAEFI